MGRSSFRCLAMFVCLGIFCLLVFSHRYCCSLPFLRNSIRWALFFALAGLCLLQMLLGPNSSHEDWCPSHNQQALTSPTPLNHSGTHVQRWIGIVLSESLSTVYWANQIIVLRMFRNSAQWGSPTKVDTSSLLSQFENDFLCNMSLTSL